MVHVKFILRTLITFRGAIALRVRAFLSRRKKTARHEYGKYKYSNYTVFVDTAIYETSSPRPYRRYVAGVSALSNEMKKN